MIYDIQTASVWKRASALLLDFIILLILATGFAVVVSLITNFDGHAKKYQDYCEQYEEEYNADTHITQEDYNQLAEADKQRYDDMFAAMNADKDVIYEYNLTIWLGVVIISVGFLSAIMIAEFIVPLIFRNGQTIGKKVFGLAVVKINSVKVTKIQLFTRVVVGKYAIELMLPILSIVWMLFGNGGPIGALLVIAIAFFQLGLCMFTRYHQPIHDVLAYTAVVDAQTQMIFNNDDELLEYKKKNHLSEINK